MITPEQYERFYQCYPKGEIELLDNAAIRVKRHPKAKGYEIFPNWRLLLSSMVRVENRWDELYCKALRYGAEVITPRVDFYGPETPVRFRCADEDCRYEWESSYYVFDNTIYKWEKKNLTKEQLSHIACPKYRRGIRKLNTQYSYYSAMSDEELLEFARKVPKKQLRTNQEFRKNNVVLSNVMNERGVGRSSLFAQFAEEQGWRRVRPELKLMTYKDWRAYLTDKGYKSVAEWRQDDPRAQHICSTLRKDTFYPLLKQEFLSPAYLFLDGVQYGSHSEKLVAKALSTLGIDFKPHGQWGFKMPDSRRFMEYDFDFTYKGREMVIEVWQCGEENLTDEELKDKKYKDYLKKRHFKQKNIPVFHPDVMLIEIEARVNRNEGQKSYLRHVKETLVQHGVIEAQNLDLDKLYEGDERPINEWSVDDFFYECKMAHWWQIDKMPTSFKNYLRSQKEMQVELAKRLAEYYRYPLNTRYYRAPVDEVIKYCSARKELHGKDAYISQHQQGKLPPGFPQNPLQMYSEIISWHQVWGEDPKVFLDYAGAKRLVQGYHFKSSGEYERARDSEDEQYLPLKQILKEPDHPQTGYIDWEDWATFLGYEKPWYSTENGVKSIEILSKGSVLAASRHIRNELKCHSKSELRHLSSYAIKALESNPQRADVEIVAFGTTSFLSWDPEVIAKTVKPVHLISEDIWRKARNRHSTYKRFPAKFYLKSDVYHGHWDNVKQLLEGYRSSSL